VQQKEAKERNDIRQDALYAVLVLRDGSVFEGAGFGASCKVTGEVVFNTGMMGYTQAVTDCSYRGQILCQTYPLIGNYGVCRSDFESEKPRIQGYAVFEACRNPSHYTSEMTLHQWLKIGGVPGIQGIDTRELTKTLRNEGTMMGALQVSENPIDKENLLEEAKSAEDPNRRDLVSEVTIDREISYAGKGRRVVVIDCGVKSGIIKALQERGIEIIRVPAGYNADKIMSMNPGGVLISNGPGDPKKVPYLIETVKNLMEYRMPIFGICLGNQILGLAMGCDTYKLKFGHRGQNHPVMEAATGKCYITSQNHGFAIHQDSVKGDVDITFVNVNDGTVEGIRHKRLPFAGVQFHPEARPGPVETKFLFDSFIKNMDGHHAKR